MFIVSQFLGSGVLVWLSLGSHMAVMEVLTAVFSFGSLTGEELISSLILVVGRIHLLAVV